MTDIGNHCLLGAIAGDIIGSRFEHRVNKSTQFELFTSFNKFTDDTVLTIAIADAILRQSDYGDILLEYARRYPHAGYGSGFRQWLYSENPKPYNSFGNGSAMRASPIGWAFDTTDEVIRQAELSALPTHNHPEGIKGAQATTLAVFLARRGSSKTEIRQKIAVRFGYDLDLTVKAIRPEYGFDVTCQGTVPPALIAFFDSESFEGAIRSAVSLGGDADTLAAITGSIAEAFYGGVPQLILKEVRNRLPDVLWQVVEAFSIRYCC